jgi:hypothetical protein
MKQSIFQISVELGIIIDQIIEAGGELTPELEEALSIKEGQLETKATKYGYAIKTMEYESQIIDEEIKRLQDLKKVRQNTMQRLKDVLSTTMQSFDIPEIQTPTLKVNFRKSSSVEILDEDKIPAEFVTIKQTKTVRKVDIKKAIKEGREIEGAQLVENQNLQIK